MAEWIYKAIAEDGGVIRGVERARSEEHLGEILREQGAYLLEQKSKAAVINSKSSTGRVKPRSVIEFSNQLSMLFRSGVPLVTGLGDLVNELDDPVLKEVLTDVHDRVSRGELLSSALARYPKVFKTDYVQIVISGEESGNLAESLERMADSMEWRIETARQFKSAFAYPAVLMLAVTGLLVLIVTFLIPRISKIFIDAGVELPAVTRRTLQVSDLLIGNWQYIVGFLAAVVVSVFVARRTSKGREFLDALLLRSPLFGPMAQMLEAASFTNLLSLLLNSGVTLVRTLEIARDAARNSIMRKRIEAIHQSVIRGKGLSVALREVGGFPSLVLRMVTIGEQSGSLVESMERVTNYFDKEVPRRVKKLLGVLEPTMTILMGAGVAFAVFSAFLPMTQLLGALRS